VGVASSQPVAAVLVTRVMSSQDSMSRIGRFLWLVALPALSGSGAVMVAAGPGYDAGTFAVRGIEAGVGGQIEVIRYLRAHDVGVGLARRSSRPVTGPATTPIRSSSPSTSHRRTVRRTQPGTVIRGRCCRRFRPLGAFQDHLVLSPG
jgi:hypothetical protein